MKKAATPTKKPATTSTKKESGKGAKSKTPKKDATGDFGPGLTVLSEKTLFLGQSLSVIQGNIADMKVDAIVNPTNGTFSLAGEVGKWQITIHGSLTLIGFDQDAVKLVFSFDIWHQEKMVDVLTSFAL